MKEELGCERHSNRHSQTPPPNEQVRSEPGTSWHVINVLGVDMVLHRNCIGVTGRLIQQAKQSGVPKISFPRIITNVEGLTMPWQPLLRMRRTWCPQRKNVAPTMTETGVTIYYTTPATTLAMVFTSKGGDPLTI